jgi:excisionase family DNA binding protein
VTDLPLLSVKEVATKLGVTVRTVQRLLVHPERRRRLDGVKVGRAVRISREALDLYLRRQRIRAARDI